MGVRERIGKGGGLRDRERMRVGGEEEGWGIGKRVGGRGVGGKGRG